MKENPAPQPHSSRSSLPGRPRFLFASTAMLLATGLLAAGCGGSDSAEAGDLEALQVVTSTDVYADIVQTIGGDAVEVTPIIDDPNVDPHSYEATAQDQLTLSRADLVVMNGGGYDEFVETMLAAADADPEVISAVEVSGLEGAEDSGHAHEEDEAEATEGEAETTEDDHAHEEGEEEHDHAHEETEEAHEESEEAHDHGSFNEHVWYSLSAMEHLAEAVEQQLSASAPDSAEEFHANTEDFLAGIAELEDRAHAVEESHGGEHVGVTEPVALYLFEDMGLENVIADEFIEAVEAGNDVPPLVLRDALAQAEGGELQLLAVNTQSAGPEAEELRQAAEDAGTPVVDVVETLPEGDDYLTWIGDTITAVENALG